MGLHRIYVEDVAPESLGEGSVVRVAGDEAHHAVRVKRLKAGARVQVLDGQGGIGEAVVTETTRSRAGWELVAQLESVQRVGPVVPRIEVYCPPPKGPRLAEMIDGLSQVGAALWAPLSTALSVTDPRPGKVERTARIAAEASKQCGRPWLLEVGDPVSLDDVLGTDAGGGGTVLADASGQWYERSGLERVRVLVGPEGGWRADEVAQARQAGLKVARFGPHIMRIETAAVVAAAIALDAEARGV